MSEAADYSFARPVPAALVAAGYKDVLRYISPAPNSKNLTLGELQSLRAVGLGLALVWESVNQRAARSGATGGAADAAMANAMADALGYPHDRVIYFVLEDPNQLPTSSWSQIDDYAKSAKLHCTRPIGGYGSQALIEHAIDAGLISRGWQVGGWSKSVSAKCHLLQRSDNPILTTMGKNLDDNFIIDEDFGQWEGTIPPSHPIETPVPVENGHHAPDGNPFTILVVDGIFGDHTIRALQWKIGAAIDGLFGPKSARALQEHLAIPDDGIVGPQTIRALQRRVGAPEDGIWGTQTTSGLQAHLNSGRF
jgi:peptidoglycan hydrolase-like protein with peptidoglycan-binding domain